MPPRRSKLIRYGGKVITLTHAAMCVRKGFKGCSNTEMRAVLKVVNRAIAAARRRR